MGDDREDNSDDARGEDRASDRAVRIGDERDGNSDDDRDDFDTASYWDEFYRCDDEVFDWYSSHEWLADVIGQAASHATALPEVLTLLDIGCGTSPLLGTLVGQYGFRPENVVGADFSKSAIEVSKVAARDAGYPIRFERVDATQMHHVFQKGQFDFVVDKGCLDCFISSDATDRIDRYMEQVRRILKPTGTFFVLPVNAADIPRLLLSGEIHLDEQALGMHVARARENWKARKKIERGVESFTPYFEIQSILAQDEKHLYSLRIARPENKASHAKHNADLAVVCNQCNTASPLGALPVNCGTCDVRLRRFALS